MLVKLNYNPERLLVYNNREETLESLKSFSKETYEFYRDGKIKDVLQEIVPGVYEYFDVNDCEHFLEGQKMDHSEFCDLERAKLLKQLWRDIPNPPRDNKIYVSYPYGVCDNYEQILEREKDIDYYINSDEKFCILMSPIYKKEQPPQGGWRWCKWGEYIGDQESVAEYLYDEPNIEMVYVWCIYKIEDV